MVEEKATVPQSSKVIALCCFLSGLCLIVFSPVLVFLGVKGTYIIGLGFALVTGACLIVKLTLKGATSRWTLGEVLGLTLMLLLTGMFWWDVKLPWWAGIGFLLAAAWMGRKDQVVRGVMNIRGVISKSR
jgi:hypothetical protein